MKFKALIVILLNCLLVLGGIPYSTFKAASAETGKTKATELIYLVSANVGDADIPALINSLECSTPTFHSRFFVSPLIPVVYSGFVKDKYSYYKTEQPVLYDEAPPLYIANRVIII